MPGAGTDKTKRWIETPAPVVVLVEPQLGENIGAAARAMANFGLSRLRLVKPQQGWPNEKAQRDGGRRRPRARRRELYDSLDDAIGDCSFVLATTARNHDQAKPVIVRARRPRRRWRRGWPAGETRRASCSGASATGSKITRSRSPTYRHAAGQSGLRVAQSGAGGGDRRL